MTIRHPAHGDLSIALTDPRGAVTVTLIEIASGPGEGFAGSRRSDAAR